MDGGNTSALIRQPRVLFASAEAFPLAKTGGLGDVCGALPAMLARLGADIRLMLPGYPQALDGVTDRRIIAELGGLIGEDECRVVAGRMPDSGLPVLLLDAPRLYERVGGLYQNGDGQDWGDNHRRFGVFCHAVARLALGEFLPQWRPDIVHLNDWHTGPVALLLDQRRAVRPKTVFTIHNLAFQGNFPLQIFPELGLPTEALIPDGIEFHGQVSFLKAGIRYGDSLTTVSPTYAREILTPEHGCGLDGLLQSRASDLVGILNGVNYDVWCPSNDTGLPSRYTPDELSGKRECKAELQRELGLSVEPDVPLIIFANRLTHQKMADVVLGAAPSMLAGGAQLVVHGEGQRSFEIGFAELARHFPQRMAVRIGYAEALAHRLHAGADIALTPSRFEPCGLTTMYAMRYGALPVTRPVGGLADIVEDINAVQDDPLHGTGFMFEEPSTEELAACTRRAIEWYGRDGAWRTMQRRAMKRDFGWERSAQRYLSIYMGLIAPTTCTPRAPIAAIRQAFPQSDPATAHQT